MIDMEQLPEALLDELSALAYECATGAARLLQSERPASGMQVDSKTTATDIVTAMDLASEEHIIGLLRTYRPQDAVVAEESGDTRGSSAVRWVVDPLDGTTNYLYGLPVWAVSVAAQIRDARAADRWHSIVGVVAAPALGSTWHARIDQPALMDNAAGRHLMSVSSCHDPGQALAATGFGYDARRRAEQGRTLAHMAPLVRDIRRMGAASVDLCWVAQGLLDAYWERGLAPWDHAAGELIVRRAGGVAADLDGGPASGSVTIAANADLWPQLAAMLRDAEVLGTGV